MKLKNILLILLVIASIVLIAGFFVMSPTYISSNNDVKHYEDNDISFDLPSTWTVSDYDNALLTPFLGSSPSTITVAPNSDNEYSYYNGSVDELSNGTVLNTSTTNATDVVIVQTEISRMDEISDNYTLEEAYKSDSIYGVMGGTSSFELVNSTSTQINGMNAYQFVYTVSYTTYQDTWIEYNGHYYRILNHAPTSVYDTAESQFNVILNSFQVK
ncbi:MAG: hypothetical protein LUG89_05440 [Methanosphaera sp.]|nr:hypothetical protein [Methanosphaera sp.]